MVLYNRKTYEYMGILCRNITVNVDGNSSGKASGSSGGKVTSYGNQEVDLSKIIGYNETLTIKNCKHESIFRRAGKKLDIDWRLIAAHAYQESGWKENTPLNSYNCGGLWGIMVRDPSTNQQYWPSKYGSESNVFNADIATKVYEDKMKAYLDKYANASSRADQIALAIQSWHDGVTVVGPSWATRTHSPSKYSSFINPSTKRGKEACSYLPSIMKQYERICS